MRVFIAVKLTEESVNLLSEQQQSIALRKPKKARPLPPSSFHLTLHFLGEKSPEEVEKILDIVERYHSRVEGLKLDIQPETTAMGFRCLTVVCQPDAELEKVYLEIGDDLAEILPDFKRQFPHLRPHITLFRSWSQPEKIELSNPGNITLETIELYQTISDERGRSIAYEIIDRELLNGRD